MHPNTFRIMKLVVSVLFLATMCFTLRMQVGLSHRSAATAQVSPEAPNALAKDQRSGGDPSVVYGDWEQFVLGENGKFILVASGPSAQRTETGVHR